MQARTKIAVAGATGRVGRHAVEILEQRGHQVVPISRSVGVDLITGEGLADALEGVTAVIDAATGPSPEQEPATEFFTTAAGNLQRFGEEAGVERIVVVSIIGVDRSTAGYGAAKQAHEQATLAGPIPARILRAAQFHELVPQLVDWGRQVGAKLEDGLREGPSFIAFARENGTVYHTYTVMAPDPFVAPYHAFLMKRTPKAEAADPRAWRKDEYPD